jgi:hypothetical protein
MIAPYPQPERPHTGWYTLAGAWIVLSITLGVIASARTWQVDTTIKADQYDAARAVSTSDFRDYWFTARYYRQTGNFTADFGVHNYLPFFTLLMVPWSYLPLWLAAGVFATLSVMLFGLGALLLEGLFGWEWKRPPRRRLLFALGLVLPYVISCATLGAIDLLIVFLIIAAWVLVEQERDWDAGIALGLAAATKILPLGLLAFFVFRKRWWTVGAAAATLVLTLTVMPILASGWERTANEYQRLAEGVLGEHTARSIIFADKPEKSHYSNQSLPIVLRRLFSPLDANPGEDREPVIINLLNLPRSIIFVLYMLIAGGLLAAGTFTTVLNRTDWPPDRETDVRVTRAQFGLWCAAIVLLTPLLWTRYLLLAYIPLAIAAAEAEASERRRDQQHTLTVAVLIAWLAAIALLAWPAARAGGAHLWTVALTWLVMCWLAQKRKKSAPQPNDSEIATNI